MEPRRSTVNGIPSDMGKKNPYLDYPICSDSPGRQLCRPPKSVFSFATLLETPNRPYCQFSKKNPALFRTSCSKMRFRVISATVVRIWKRPLVNMSTFLLDFQP